MDQKLQQGQEIERLIRASAAARSTLGAEVVSIKQRFNVPARVKGSLKTHPTGWMIGSVFLGLAVSLIFKRRPPARVKKKKGFALTLLGLSLTLVRPLVKIWLSGQVKQYFSAHRTEPQSRSQHSALHSPSHFQ